ncbi:hypothetical protein DSCW_32380 [Desulfosarcina widdelii]|uniref:Uncharacterized protein n=1 Tax=Desulfosarcina widdelii TaxID=947919 RepID=A0A5K7Z7Y2_9BACT|nr:hypothetical protein DSCW_32380 [Desulfosarcina widdelii]
MRVFIQGRRVIPLVKKLIGLPGKGSLIQVTATAGKHRNDHDADDKAPKKTACAFGPWARKRSGAG